ncbi:MAG: group 1 truncated hemoglobin [Anaerolineae bacterium]|nr:group 1 truncated hemoglobin [Anaerolineae bacterium]
MAKEQASLYERLGGIYAVAAVIDDFIDRIMADPILNANPHIKEAHERITPAGFKYLVTEFSCMAMGGPQQYTGRSMPESHEHLEMTNREWDAFMHALDQSLYTFDVPEAEQNEIVTLMESLKPDMGLID